MSDLNNDAFTKLCDLLKPNWNTATGFTTEGQQYFNSYIAVFGKNGISPYQFDKTVDWLATYRGNDDEITRMMTSRGFPHAGQMLAAIKKYRSAHLDIAGSIDEHNKYTQKVMHWVHIWQAIRFFGLWDDNMLFPGESVSTAQGRVLRDLTNDDKRVISAYIKIFEDLEHGGSEASAAKLKLELDIEYRDLPIEKRRIYFGELMEEFKDPEKLREFDQQMEDRWKKPPVFKTVEEIDPTPTYRREMRDLNNDAFTKLCDLLKPKGNMVINEETGEEDLPF